MSLPTLTIGMVASQDPENGGMYVLLRSSGQGPAYFVTVGYQGAADALNIEQKPLPRVGTWGLIAFPYGDPRNGIWVMSILPSQMDALTASISGIGPLPATDSAIDYQANFAGGWKYTDAAGQFFSVFPDGSIVAVCSGSVTSSGDLPQMYRHILVNNQRTRVPFNLSDRVSKSPSPYGVALVMQQVLLTTQVQVSGSLGATGNLSAGNGDTGSFSTPDGRTVTVIQGIVVSIA